MNRKSVLFREPEAVADIPPDVLRAVRVGTGDGFHAAFRGEFPDRIPRVHHARRAVRKKGARFAHAVGVDFNRDSERRRRLHDFAVERGDFRRPERRAECGQIGMCEVADQSRFHETDRAFHVAADTLKRERAVRVAVILFIADPVDSADEVVEPVLPEEKVFVICHAEILEKVDFGTEENGQLREFPFCFADVADIIGKFAEFHAAGAVASVGEGGVVGKTENPDSLLHRFGAVFVHRARCVFAAERVRVKICQRYISIHGGTSFPGNISPEF